MRVLALCFWIAILIPAGTAQARDVALLIGNAAYQHEQNLGSPHQDVAAMAQRLQALGYDEVVVREDLGVDAFDEALEAFRALADGADTAVFYYAGHGLELNGENYLIPVDAELPTERRARREAVALEDARDALSGADGLRLVIIDACRNNGFGGRDRMAGAPIDRGFRPPRGRTGEIMLFSTQPGATARDDGPGDLSPFATALGEALDGSPDEDLRTLFTTLTARVSELAARRQSPYLVPSTGFGGGVHVSLTGIANRASQDASRLALANELARIQSWSACEDARAYVNAGVGAFLPYAQSRANVLCAAAPAPSACAAGELEFTVYFDYDYAVLNQANVQTIANALDNLGDCAVSWVSLVGHTAREGAASYNVRLSERRARVVRDELVRLGVPAGVISLEALGESQPYLPTADGVDEALNRRVEVSIQLVDAG